MHPRDFDVGLDEPSIGRLAERAEAGEVVTFETRHRRKDGTTLPVEIRSGTFRQGGKLFYLALARDITERKAAEEDLRASEAALRESEQRYRTLFEKANEKWIRKSLSFRSSPSNIDCGGSLVAASTGVSDRTSCGGGGSSRVHSPLSWPPCCCHVHSRDVRSVSFVVAVTCCYSFTRCC